MIAALCALVLTAVPGRMAREQVFFTGAAPEPVLLAVVLQRTTDGTPGAPTAVEAKAFLAWDGAWRTPFFERVTLPRWPGDDPESAVAAWQAARMGPRLRVRYRDAAQGFVLGLRRPGGGLTVAAVGLRSAGAGDDPHGTVTWRAGPGRLTLNGREIPGTVVVERLAVVRSAWPWFGRFEMWLRRPPEGGLQLARVHLHGRDGRGLGLAVDPSGAARLEPFVCTVAATRLDPVTGRLVPTSWRLWDDTELVRTGGEAGRGSDPAGGAALYDIGAALAPPTADAALVFHLEDAGGPPLRPPAGAGAAPATPVALPPTPIATP